MLHWHQSNNEIPIHLPHNGICRDLLTKSISNTGITYWNIVLVAPNILFLIFLAYKVGVISRILSQQRFPVVKPLLILVLVVSILSVLRGILTTIFSTTKLDDSFSNEVLWLVLRFFFLAMENSVLGFGFFGYRSVTDVGKRVLSLSFYLSLVYITVQTILLVTHSNNVNNEYMMFNHFGMLFWLISATIYFCIYSLIVILPRANILCGRGFLSLPFNRAFYRYALILCLVNIFQIVGSLMAYVHIHTGLCILNASVLFYYCFYSIFVYFTFLRKSFRILGSGSNEGRSRSNTESSESDLESNGLV